jgi:hypothetical protein
VHTLLRLPLALALALAAACQKGPEPRSAGNAADSQPSMTHGSSDSIAAGPDTLNRMLCKGIDNSYKCAQAIERHVLAEGGHGVSRRGAQLVIPLLRGDTLLLRDSAPATATGELHSYRAYLPSIGYHVVELQYDEGGLFFLVNGRSGKITFSHGLPVVSPDNRRVAAGNVDLEAEFSPTTLQIWRVDSDSLALEWEHDFLSDAQASDSIWGPSEVRWDRPTEIRLTKQYPMGEKRGNAFVHLGPAGWALSEP